VVKSLSSVVSAGRIVASGWDGGKCGISAPRELSFGFLNPEDRLDSVSGGVRKKCNVECSEVQ